MYRRSSLCVCDVVSNNLFSSSGAGNWLDMAKTHSSMINVVDVEQIENPRLHQMYGHTARALCGTSGGVPEGDLQLK